MVVWLILEGFMFLMDREWARLVFAIMTFVFGLVCVFGFNVLMSSANYERSGVRMNRSTTAPGRDRILLRVR